MIKWLIFPLGFPFCRGIQKCFIIIDECTLEIERSEIQYILRNFALNQHDFPSKTNRGNYFPFNLYCFGLEFKKMNENFPFGGLTGFGNSCED